MRFKFLLISVIVLANNFTNVFAQNPLVDSLLHELAIAKHDTVKINIYNQLSAIYTRTKPDEAFNYVKKAFDISESLANSDDEYIILFVKKNNSVSYTNLGNYYKALGDYYSALENYKKSNEILSEINDKQALADNYTLIGIVKYRSGDYAAADDYYNKALEIHKELKNETGKAKVYLNFGNLYLKQGDYPLSIEYYQKSLEISEKLNDKKNASRCYNNIGYIYTETKRYDWAIDYLNKNLKIKESINDRRGVATAMNNIGNVYLEKNEYDSALVYFTQSLSIRREVQAIRHEAISLQNMGRVYFAQKRYDIAEEYLQNALRIYKRVEESEKIGNIYTELASLKIEENKFNNAIKYADSSLIIALELKALPMQKDCYKLLAVSYEKKGSLLKAYEFLKQYTTVKDSILEQVAEKLIKSETRYRVGQKQKEIEAQKLKIETQDAQAKNQQMKMYFSLSALLVMIVLAFVFYRNFKQKIRANDLLRRQKREIEDQKEEIEKQRDVVVEQNRIVLEQKKEITDSIIYAKNIQRAVMPSEELLNSVLPEHFLMFRPKDIVSGDFYWMKQIKNFIVIAVADCTGHGVPGAFMSMLGSLFLSETVTSRSLDDAGLILNKMREKIKKSLHQSGKEGEAKDGMDMSFFIIDSETREVQFSGAFNPLYIIRDNDKIDDVAALEDLGFSLYKPQEFNATVIEIKGDRQPIAIYTNEKDFTSHTFQLMEGDRIYSFSDGYPDQFGGEKGKKLKARNFKNLLLTCKNRPMKEQEEFMQNSFDEWKGEIAQIDDVILMGLKIS
ncbi:MAG: tetratricopeptide repeat protein [Bacteroidota bacterium]